MYRGKNQDYKKPKKGRPTLFTGMAGEVSPECLKRVFFGDPFHQEKGHGYLFGY